MTEPTPTQEKKRAFDTYEVTVEQADLVTPRNKHLRFRLPAGKELNFKAGQFMQMFIPTAEGKPRRTSYSIASAPTHKEYFELCVTLVNGGTSSGFLHALKKGDKLQAMGPLGTFTFKDEGRDSVFIATGSGIAPFRSMINDLLEKKTSLNLYLVFGNRYDPDIIYQKEWEALAKAHPNFKALFTLSRGTDAWKGERGYVQEKIAGFVPDLAGKNFYICGLVNMINAVQEKLLSLGVPKERIHFERYD